MTVREDIRYAGDWLAKNALDARDVQDDVKIGVAYFVLIWSLFDFRFLNAEGRLKDVLNFIDDRILNDLNVQDFEPHLTYFRNRYLDGGRPNHHLEALAGSDYQSADRIVHCLQQLGPTPKEVIGSLLLVSYRLRCNLVHGSKWEQGLADQYENFRHASKVMMLIMDRY